MVRPGLAYSSISVLLLVALAVNFPFPATAISAAQGSSFVVPLDRGFSADGGTDPQVGDATPPAMIHHQMVYDSESDRIILTGSNKETWAYDYNADTWTNMGSSAPRAWNHATAYDSESDRVILFGGGTGGGEMSNETWAYDYNAETWTHRLPSRRPPGRHLPAMAYDSESDGVILFGGGHSIGYRHEDYNDTWAYDFNTDTWTQMNPFPGPSARRGHAMAYDSESDRVILFGGTTGTGPGLSLGDTWAYDFNTDTWTMMTYYPSPGRQDAHALAYDSESDRVILYGRGTWAYDLNTDRWSRMSPSNAPPATWNHAIAHDSESDRVILFGGGPGRGKETSDETWAYDFNADTWTRYQATAPGAPRKLQATPLDVQVRLAWKPPWDDGGSPITNYRIYRGTSPGDLTFILEIVNVEAYSDVGLANNITYYYRVSAVNLLGEGKRSDRAFATPMPDTAKPEIEILTPEDGSVLNSTSVRVSGAAYDSTSLERVECSADGENWVLANGTFVWSATLNLTEGTNTIYARATDASDNTATQSITVHIELPKAPPEFSRWAMFAMVVTVAALLSTAALLFRKMLGGEGH